MLRRVCGAFPFRSNDPSKASLSEDSSTISKHMKELLQERVKVAGFEILNMNIMEIAYIPAMA